MSNAENVDKAKRLVIRHHNRSVSGPSDTLLEADDVYIVWFVKALDNWKALVSTTIDDGKYYELTYNGAAEETYIDVYVKSQNVCVRDDER